MAISLGQVSVDFDSNLDTLMASLDALSNKLSGLTTKGGAIKVEIAGGAASALESIAANLDRAMSTAAKFSQVIRTTFDSLDGRLGNTGKQIEATIGKQISATAVEAEDGISRFFAKLARGTQRVSPLVLGSLLGIAATVERIIASGFNFYAIIPDLFRQSGTGLGMLNSLTAGFVSLIRDLNPMGLLNVSKDIGLSLLSFTSVLSIALTGVQAITRLTLGFLAKRPDSFLARMTKLITAFDTGLLGLSYNTRVFIERASFLVSLTTTTAFAVKAITVGITGLGSAIVPVVGLVTTTLAGVRFLSTKISVWFLRWRASAGDGRAATALMLQSIRQMFPIFEALAKHAKPLAKNIANFAKLNMAGKLTNLHQVVMRLVKQLEKVVPALDALASRFTEVMANVTVGLRKTDAAATEVFEKTGRKGARDSIEAAEKIETRWSRITGIFANLNEKAKRLGPTLAKVAFAGATGAAAIYAQLSGKDVTSALTTATAAEGVLGGLSNTVATLVGGLMKIPVLVATTTGNVLQFTDAAFGLGGALQGVSVAATGFVGVIGGLFAMRGVVNIFKSLKTGAKAFFEELRPIFTTGWTMIATTTKRMVTPLVTGVLDVLKVTVFKGMSDASTLIGEFIDDLVKSRAVVWVRGLMDRPDMAGAVARSAKGGAGLFVETLRTGLSAVSAVIVAPFSMKHARKQVERTFRGLARMIVASFKTATSATELFFRTLAATPSIIQKTWRGLKKLGSALLSFFNIKKKSKGTPSLGLDLAAAENERGIARDRVNDAMSKYEKAKSGKKKSSGHLEDLRQQLLEYEKISRVVHETELKMRGLEQTTRPELMMPLAAGQPGGGTEKLADIKKRVDAIEKATERLRSGEGGIPLGKNLAEAVTGGFAEDAKGFFKTVFGTVADKLRGLNEQLRQAPRNPKEVAARDEAIGKIKNVAEAYAKLEGTLKGSAETQEKLKSKLDKVGKEADKHAMQEQDVGEMSEALYHQYRSATDALAKNQQSSERMDTLITRVKDDWLATANSEIRQMDKSVEKERAKLRAVETASKVLTRLSKSMDGFKLNDPIMRQIPDEVRQFIAALTDERDTIQARVDTAQTDLVKARKNGSSTRRLERDLDSARTDLANWNMKYFQEGQPLDGMQQKQKEMAKLYRKNIATESAKLTEFLSKQETLLPEFNKMREGFIKVRNSTEQSADALDYVRTQLMSLGRGSDDKDVKSAAAAANVTKLFDNSLSDYADMSKTLNKMSKQMNLSVGQQAQFDQAMSAYESALEVATATTTKADKLQQHLKVAQVELVQALEEEAAASAEAHKLNDPKVHAITKRTIEQKILEAQKNAYIKLNAMQQMMGEAELVLSSTFDSSSGFGIMKSQAHSMMKLMGISEKSLRTEATAREALGAALVEAKKQKVKQRADEAILATMGRKTEEELNTAERKRIDGYRLQAVAEMEELDTSLRLAEEKKKLEKALEESVAIERQLNKAEANRIPVTKAMTDLLGVSKEEIKEMNKTAEMYGMSVRNASDLHKVAAKTAAAQDAAIKKDLSETAAKATVQESILTAEEQLLAEMREQVGGMSRANDKLKEWSDSMDESASAAKTQAQYLRERLARRKVADLAGDAERMSKGRPGQTDGALNLIKLLLGMDVSGTSNISRETEGNLMRESKTPGKHMDRGRSLHSAAKILQETGDYTKSFLDLVSKQSSVKQLERLTYAFKGLVNIINDVNPTRLNKLASTYGAANIQKALQFSAIAKQIFEAQKLVLHNPGAIDTKGSPKSKAVQDARRGMLRELINAVREGASADATQTRIADKLPKRAFTQRGLEFNKAAGGGVDAAMQQISAALNGTVFGDEAYDMALRIVEEMSDGLLAGTQDLDKSVEELTDKAIGEQMRLHSPPKRGPIRTALLSLTKFGKTAAQMIAKGGPELTAGVMKMTDGAAAGLARFSVTIGDKIGKAFRNVKTGNRGTDVIAKMLGFTAQGLSRTLGAMVMLAGKVVGPMLGWGIRTGAGGLRMMFGKFLKKNVRDQLPGSLPKFGPLREGIMSMRHVGPMMGEYMMRSAGFLKDITGKLLKGNLVDVVADSMVAASQIVASGFSAFGGLLEFSGGLLESVVSIPVQIAGSLAKVIPFIGGALSGLIGTIGAAVGKILALPMKALGALSKMVGTALGKIGESVSGLFQTLLNQATELSNKIATLSRSAKALGLEINTLKAFQFAAERVGASSSEITQAFLALQQGMSQMSREGGIGELADAFALAGINAQNLHKMGPDQIFLAIVDAVRSGTLSFQEQERLLQTINASFGGLRDLVFDTDVNLRDLVAKVSELPDVTDKGVAAAKRWQAVMGTISNFFQSIQQVLFEEIMPYITEMVDGVGMSNKGMIKFFSYVRMVTRVAMRSISEIIKYIKENWLSGEDGTNKFFHDIKVLATGVWRAISVLWKTGAGAGFDWVKSKVKQYWALVPNWAKLQFAAVKMRAIAWVKGMGAYALAEVKHIGREMAALTLDTMRSDEENKEQKKYRERLRSSERSLAWSESKAASAEAEDDIIRLRAKMLTDAVENLDTINSTFEERQQLMPTAEELKERFGNLMDGSSDTQVLKDIWVEHREKLRKAAEEEDEEYYAKSPYLPRGTHISNSGANRGDNRRLEAFENEGLITWLEKWNANAEKRLKFFEKGIDTREQYEERGGTKVDVDSEVRAKQMKAWDAKYEAAVKKGERFDYYGEGYPRRKRTLSYEEYVESMNERQLRDLKYLAKIGALEDKVLSFGRKERVAEAVEEPDAIGHVFKDALAGAVFEFGDYVNKHAAPEMKGLGTKLGDIVNEEAAARSAQVIKDLAALEERKKKGKEDKKEKDSQLDAWAAIMAKARSVARTTRDIAEGTRAMSNNLKVLQEVNAQRAAENAKIVERVAAAPDLFPRANVEAYTLAIKLAAQRRAKMFKDEKMQAEYLAENLPAYEKAYDDFDKTRGETLAKIREAYFSGDTTLAMQLARDLEDTTKEINTKLYDLLGKDLAAKFKETPPVTEALLVSLRETDVAKVAQRLRSLLGDAFSDLGIDNVFEADRDLGARAEKLERLANQVRLERDPEKQAEMLRIMAQQLGLEEMTLKTITEREEALTSILHKSNMLGDIADAELQAQRQIKKENLHSENSFEKRIEDATTGGGNYFGFDDDAAKSFRQSTYDVRNMLNKKGITRDGALEKLDMMGVDAAAAGIDIGEDSLDVIKAKTQQYFDNAENKIRLYPFVDEKLVSPITNEIGTTIKDMASGAFSDAMHEAEDKAKAAGMKFNRALYAISKFASSVFNSMFDSIVKQFTDSLQSGLSSALSGVLGGAAAGIAQGALAAGFLILSKLQSNVETIHEGVEDAITSTEELRGVVSGNSTVAIKEIDDSLRNANRGIEDRLDRIAGLIQGFGGVSGIGLTRGTTLAP